MKKVKYYTHEERLAIVEIAAINNPNAVCSCINDTIFIDTLDDDNFLVNSEQYELTEYILSLPLPN